MCDAGTIIGAMTSIVAHGEQQQRAQRNEESANAAYLSDARQLNLRQRQEEEAESQRGQDADIQSMKDVATARTASGESGVSGLSVNALITDINRQNLFDDTKATSNLDATKAQIAEEKEGAKAGRQSRINSVPYPSFAATALQIGGSAYESNPGYFDNLKNPFKKKNPASYNHR
jgi:hypothetical protein|tara:strand:- start:5188 stop:5712 length:525 start_codon:yes stop_codon:yes gene_type:complete